jgi:CRP-like cAMP-binding protein
MNAVMKPNPSAAPAPVGKCGSSHPCLVELIAGHPFAKDMPRRVLERLADFAIETEFAPGEVIFREGDPANRFYLLLEGKVALESFVEGRGLVTVQTLSGGEVLGWSWLFPPYYWHFDARAVEPTRAVFLYGTPLRELCAEDPQIGYELFKRFAAIVVNRLQATRRQLLQCQAAGGAGC